MNIGLANQTPYQTLITKFTSVQMGVSVLDPNILLPVSVEITVSVEFKITYFIFYPSPLMPFQVVMMVKSFFLIYYFFRNPAYLIFM